MEIFKQVLGSAIHPAEEADGDYRKDGLLYCGKCNTPKEMKLPNVFSTDGGQHVIVPIPCSCREAEIDAEDAKRKQRERRTKAQEAMQILESIGAITRPTSTFSKSVADIGKNEMIVRRYAERFDKALAENIGLMLFGQMGCGKTFYAQCIANAVIDQGRMVMYTSIRRLVRAMKNEAEFVLRSVKGCDLLVLDDLGAERNTEFMAEQAFEIINTRYEAHKPLIVTTNLDPNALKSEQDLTYGRAYQRVLEMCPAVKIEGATRRKQLAIAKLGKLEELLK